MSNERTIRVTGTGTLSAAPDVMRMTMTVERTHSEYSATVNAAESAAKALSAALAKHGFSENVRMLSLRTEPRYEVVTDENGLRTRRFAGYAAVRRLRAETNADPARTCELIAAVSESGTAAELSAEYALRDENAFRGELLARAVKDAKARAKAIAKAAGVKLGDLLTVENGAHAVPFVRAAALRADSGAEIAPEDITLSDEITAVFSIG